jgi:DNA topoisomerase-1
VRDENKYERMKAFADALPAIRLQVEHDLSLPGLPREKILATIVRLLETTFIRVGNEEYARQNRSYGLTTMRNRHVDVTGATVHFKFQGKSGVHHTIDLNDRRLARIVKRCLDVPGYELFQYLDDEGAHHAVDAADVNDYLRSIASEQFTAKDFRTWAGTVLACSTLRAMGEFASATEGKRNIVRAIATVAQRLGNTPSVCRKCYIHPTVIACYLDGGMTKALARKIRRHKPVSPHALLEEELHLVRLLENAVKSAA